MSGKTGLSVGQLAGLDGVAVKPAVHDVEWADRLPTQRIIIDYEGVDFVPDRSTLQRLATSTSEVRLTVPVRADGFDPLGRSQRLSDLPAGLNQVLVPGNPAYLSAAERDRPIAPRLQAAVAAADDPWVGTESIERLALATGATQFELLSGGTEHDLRALRDAGHEGEIAVYAPVVLSEDPDTILDALGSYAARRDPVAADLPTEAPTDATASGQTRKRLLRACSAYGLVGDRRSVRERADALRSAGATYVVGYPATGLGALR